MNFFLDTSMFNYAGTSRAGAGAATATPPSSGSIFQTNQQPSKPSMRRDLSNRSSKSIVGGGGSLWRVQWKMKARVLGPVWHRTRHRHCGCTTAQSLLKSQNRNDCLDFFLSVARLRLGFGPSKG